MRGSGWTRTAAVISVVLAAGWCTAAADVGGRRVPLGQPIQAAIDGAPAGAVLLLDPGRYVENLIVEKDLTLRGAADGTTEIAGAVYGAVVRARGDGVRVHLEDLTIRDAPGLHGHGLLVEGTCAVDARRVSFLANQWCGLRSEDRSTVRCEACLFGGNGTSGLASADFSHVDLVSCEIRDNVSHGIHALHLSEVTVESCEVAGNYAGIWAWDAARVVVVGTSVRENGNGIMAANAALIDASDSFVVGNEFDGLRFEESTRCVMNACQVTGNGGDGLYAMQDAVLEIYDSTFAGNGSAGLRTSAASCIGGFDHGRYFGGRVEGSGNVVTAPGSPEGNGEAALCPAPPGTWPPGFTDWVLSW